MQHLYQTHPSSLSELNRFVREHVRLIPFNNIDVLLEREMPLDPSHLKNKILEEGRGGYCFELNRLCYDYLGELGWPVRLSLGRVLNNHMVDRPRTHRVTLIDMKSQSYLVDVGFGHLGPRLPIPLDGEVVACDGFQWRVETQGALLFMQVLLEDEWFTLYTFDHYHYNEQDAELSHFWSYKSPQSVFQKRFCIGCCPYESKAPCIINLTYKELSPNQSIEHFISSEEEFQSILETIFSVDLPCNELNQLYYQTNRLHQRALQLQS